MSVRKRFFLSVSKKFLVLAAVAGLTACHGTNVRFQNHSSPLVPMVRPDPQEFKMDFVVENGSDQTFEIGKLVAELDVVYNTDFAPDACIKNISIPMPHLVPEQKLGFFSYEFEKNDFAGDPCHCLKNSCYGRIVLRLKNAAGNLMPGPNTHMQVTWTKSGNTDDVSVIDQSP